MRKGGRPKPKTEYLGSPFPEGEYNCPKTAHDGMDETDYAECLHGRLADGVDLSQFHYPTNLGATEAEIRGGPPKPRKSLNYGMLSTLGINYWNKHLQRAIQNNFKKRKKPR